MPNTKYNSRIQEILSNINKPVSHDIHEPEWNAAKEIILSFTAHEHPNDEHNTRNRHVFLIAEMQSGKTGVCTSTANMLRINELKSYFGIERYFFITGMNANGLHEQTSDRVRKALSLDENDTTVSIYKNSDLGNILQLSNSIIFIDESHYGNKEKDRVTKWIQSWDNDRDGYLRKNNIYIVSVSATPFDELNSDTSDTKQQVILKTESGYIGVSEFLKNEQIIQAENTEQDIMLRIDEAYNRMPEDKKGLLFIRTTKKQIKSNPILKERFNVVELDTSNNKSIDFKQIELQFEVMLSGRKEEHRKPIIFFIKEAMRAGQTLDAEIKDYTYLVYDFTSNLPETTAQGLLGRMCGYRKYNNKNTLFYVNKAHAEQYDKWKQEEFPKTGIPPVRTNKQVKKPLVSEPNGNHYVLHLSNVEKQKIQYRGATAAWKIFHEILKNHPEAAYDFIGEVYIGNYAIGDSVHKKWIQPDQGINAFRSESPMFKKITGRNEFIVEEDVNKKFIHIVLKNDEYVIHPGILKEPKINNRPRSVKRHLDTN